MSKKRHINARIFASCVVLVLVLSISITVVGFYTYCSSMYDQYDRLVSGVVKSAAGYVDKDDMIKCIKMSKKSEKYYETQYLFNDLKRSTEVEYIYFISFPDENDPNEIVYVINAVTDTDIEKYGSEENVASLGSVAVNEYPEKLASRFIGMLNGEDKVTIIENTTSFGKMLSAFIPIKSSNGKNIGLIGSDISIDTIHNTMMRYIVMIVLWTLLFSVLFLFIFMKRIKYTLIDPIERLSIGALDFVLQSKKITDPNDMKFKEIDIPINDEINDLYKSISSMTEDLKKYMKNLEKSIAEKQKIHSELNVAKKIQESMLPTIFPAFPNRGDIDIFATMDPAKEVGGDFYDFFFIDETHLAMLIADVSGKGVAAALFMVIAKTLLKNEAQNGESIERVLTKVNEKLCENNDEQMFVTAFAAVFNMKTGELVFSNAGHNKPLIYRSESGRFDWLTTKHGFILAGLKGIKYKLEKTYLDKGDILYMYTDGVTEALNKKNELFSDPRLLETLNNESLKNLSLKDCLSTIREKIDIFSDGADRSDDITMLIFKNKSVVYNPNPEGNNLID